MLDPATQPLPALCALTQRFERAADLGRPISVSLVAEFDQENIMPGMFTTGSAVDTRQVEAVNAEYGKSLRQGAAGLMIDSESDQAFPLFRLSLFIA